MHVSLSFDLVRWRANLWSEQHRCPDDDPAKRDKPLTLHQPALRQPPDDDAPDTETPRFVRKPVRVVYTPRTGRRSS